MFEEYPKKRNTLPPQYQDIYVEQYKSNRQGKGKTSWLSQKMESWLHKKVAADVHISHKKSTLEIGAGTLNQLKYEHSINYDVVEPFKELYVDSPYIDKVKEIYADIDEVDINKKYDRITSIATFEHIIDLPKVVAKTCLLLNSGGTLRTSIPNEGTFLWTLGWRMTTGLAFCLKNGLDYGVLMKHEHVNTAKEIESVLHYFYNTNKCHTFGLNKKVALYRFYESSVPNTERAKEYLEHN